MNTQEIYQQPVQYPAIEPVGYAASNEREIHYLHGSLGSALGAAQAEFPIINKNRTAKIVTSKGEYSYKYADLPAILEIVRPILRKHGLTLSQPTAVYEGKSFVTTMLMWDKRDAAGEITNTEVLRSDGVLLPTTLEPKALGAHITFFRRYDLCATLGIVTEEDNDIDSSPSKRAKQGGQARPAPVPPPPSSAPVVADEVKTQLQSFKAIVGPQPLKKFILTYTGATQISAVTPEQYNQVIKVLAAAKAKSDKSLIALVNGD